MKRFVMVLLVVALAAPPAFPVAKEIIQLQQAVAQLQSDLRDLRSAMDERMGMMRQILEQSNATVNKLNLAVEGVQRSIQNSIAAQGAKVDTLTGNTQAVHDSLEDLKARVAKLSEQMAQMRTALETLQAPPPAPQPAVQQQQPVSPVPAPTVRPSPEELYQNALRDLNGGNLDIAMRGFQDYLRYYPDTDLAGNAQFYIGEVLYRQGKLREAVEAYDLVLERYPRGNKTPTSHLKKGFALLQLKDREAGERELRELIRRFPNSDEAKIARDRIKSLGSSPDRGSTRAPAKSTSRRHRR